MKTKRVLAILLATAMMCSLAGCGGTEKHPAATETPTEDKQSAEEPAGEPTEMRIMWVGDGTSAKDKVVDAVVENFNATNEYNVKFVLERYENDTYKTKLPTLMTQNDVADVFFTWNYASLEPYVEAGKVYCLDEALAADPEWSGRFGGAIMDGATFDGKVYGTPLTNCLYPTFYNKAIFEECGVTPPTTWDEFIDVCKTVKEKGHTPFALGGSEGWVLGQFLTRMVCCTGGFEAYNSIRYGKASWEDPEFIKAGELLEELVEEIGIFPENFVGLSYNEAEGMFMNGETAMYHQGTWVTAGFVENMGDNVGAFYMPLYDEAHAGSNMSASDNTLCIAETCENKEAAVALVKMFSDPEWQKKMLIEGGEYPATNVTFEEGEVPALFAEILEMSADISPVGPFELILGTNVGNEFNNVAVGIASGKDVKEQFAYLQEYMLSENE